MKSTILLLSTCALVAVLACTEPAASPTCVARLRGKIVSTGPACAGIAIQILSEHFGPARVDSLWFDAYVDNPPTYRNVFKTYPYCSTESDEEQLLLEALEKGTVFYFIFAPTENSSDCGFADCTVCKPLVSLPESTHRILIVTEECNDQVTIYE